jgi:hypothetical protein
MARPRQGPCEAGIALDRTRVPVVVIKCEWPGRSRPGHMDIILCDDCYVTLLLMEEQDATK